MERKMMSNDSVGAWRKLWNAGSRRSPASIAEAAGRGRARATSRWEHMESLESRVLLGADQPGLPNPWNPAVGDPITLTVAAATNPSNGSGTATGTISNVNDDDMFRFTMPGAAGTFDFVTVLADTIPGSSTLDSYVEVYNAAGTRIAVGSHNGIISETAPAVTPDGWAGFVGEGGQDYYIRVRTQQGPLGAGRTAVGNYTIRVDAASINLTINDMFDAMDPNPYGQGTIDGTLTFRQQDIVYRVNTPADVVGNPSFSSLATIIATADPADLDTHLEAYSSDGAQLATDRQAGRLTDAYVTVFGAPESRFYIRVRADELGVDGPAPMAQSLGMFTVVVDFNATTLETDLVTRLSAPDIRDVVPNGTIPNVYRFKAQGTGLAFITVQPTFDLLPIPPITDPAVHIHDEFGTRFAFNDDNVGTDAQLEVVVTGGKDYYIVVEDFDDPNPNAGAYSIFIEAHHTFGPTIPVDDHVDVVTPPNIRQFEQATPLIFNEPFRLTGPEGVPDGNEVRDRGWLQSAFGRGRIQDINDTDLFQFTVPVAQLGNWAGNDGNEGSALYFGGNFATVGPAATTQSGQPLTAHNAAIWDAADWWNAGGADEANQAIDGPIFALTTWVTGGRTILVAGGEFTMVGGRAAGNLAFRQFDPQRGFFVWSRNLTPSGLGDPVTSDGPVFALEQFDLLAASAGNELIVGGDFTMLAGTAVNNVGALRGTLTADAMGGGVMGGADPEVHAIHVFDPPQEPDPDFAGPGMRPMDKPAGLYIGGTFTNRGNNIARYGAATMGGAPAWEVLGTDAGNAGVNGVNDTVLAIGTYDDPGMRMVPTDTMGGMEEQEIPPVLVVGGEFGIAGNVNANFIATWDPSIIANPAANTNRWDNMAAGAPGAVRAIETWIPYASIDPDQVPVLIAAGDNAGGETTGNVSFWNTAWNQIADADDGTFRAVAVFADNEPFNITTEQALYVAGDFTVFLGTPDVNRAAYLDETPLGPQWFTLGAGLQDMSPDPPPALPTSSVFAMAQFDDDIGGIFDRHERTRSRVAMTLSPTFDSYLNTFLTVYDSNLQIIYTNETIAPPFPDPSGMIDYSRPALAGPGMNFRGIAVWPGETYYVAVSASQQGSGTGRYTLTVSTDALPPEDPNDGDGFYDDINSAVFETPDAGQWADAPEQVLGVNSGDTRTFSDPFQNGGNIARQFVPTPSGILIVDLVGLPAIETVTDTDLFQFRAPNDGTVEIRVATKNITNRFRERQIDLITGDETQVDLEKTYNSGLDAVMRVFNNDFVEIGYSDDNPGVGGFADTFEAFNAGIPADGVRTFVHDDPRIVINARRGETYFIQVESSQLGYATDLDPNVQALVDHRHAAGAYEVIINANPYLNGIDDHDTGSVVAGTAIPIDETTGDGQIDGAIDDVFSGAFQNPNDLDLFNYIAVTQGQVFITLEPTNPLLQGTLIIIDANFNVVDQITAPAGQTITTSFFAAQGDRFFFGVDGANGSEGTYVVSIDGPGYDDDHASDHNWVLATGLVLDPFFGTATAQGVIENPGDRDVFVYRAETYEVATVRVTATSATLDPVVRVYEISMDGADGDFPPTFNPVVLQIGVNNDAAGGGTNSASDFSITPGRDYLIVVGGLDESVHFGSYEVEVQVASTDDHPNIGSLPLATTINLTFDPLNQTGMGSNTGVLEVNTDTDLFRFTAPANGLAQVVVTTPDSNLAPRVTIYDAFGNVLVASVDGTAGSATINIPTIVANTQYFVLVDAGATGAMEPDDTGSYTVSVSTEPVDDHPDVGDFAGIVDPRDVIVLAPTSGVGTNSGVIVPGTDSDLFRFATIAAGSTQIRITTSGSNLNPKVVIFNSSFTQIDSVNGNGDSATATITAGAAAEVYYILVLPADSASGSTAVGNYTVTVTGQRPGGGPGDPPPDDHANAGEWNDASPILLSGSTGFGFRTGVVNYSGDTDLFRFTPAAGGTTDIQLNVPAGGLVDGSIRVFDSAFTLIGQNSSGIPGATAAFSFAGTAGEQYFILVEPAGSATGSYTIRVGAQPTTHTLYYPEGFAGATIDEFVSIVNPNPFAVTYQLYARYETGELDPNPVKTGTIQPSRRGGVTIITRPNQLGSLVRRGVPYALELRSSGLLGATFSHYDFNVSVGESFTNRLSTTWTLAAVNKDPAVYRDFIVFYNPNNVDTTATVTIFYQNGTSFTFNQNLRAQRRGGINVNSDGRIPNNGVFGVKVETALPVVVAQTTYNLSNGGGDGLLADPDGGATVGVIPGISAGNGVTSSIGILNTGLTTATVTITASYARLDLPDLVRVVTVAPGRSFNSSLLTLGLVSGETAGLRYSSNVPVTVSTIEYKNGDGDSTFAGTAAALTQVIGDAFVDPRQAGIKYLEQLSLYNPASTAIDVTIRFLFPDGSFGTTTVGVNAGDFTFVQVDQDPNILSRPRATGFSISVTSETPIVAAFTHYDLFLNGGWGTIAAPVGLTIPLASI